MMRLHSKHSLSGYADDPWFVGALRSWFLTSLRSMLPQLLNVAACLWSPGQMRVKPSSKPDGAPQIAVRFLYGRSNWHWSTTTRCAPDRDAQDLNAESFSIKEAMGCSNV